MAPPFGRGRRERAALDRATRGEVERLRALPRAELAVELMGAFGPEGPRSHAVARRTPNLIELTEWLLRAQARPGRHVLELAGPVRDALRMLEHAGLIEWRGSEMVGTRARLGATALGDVALAQGTVWEYLDEETDDAP
jgi:hypothetical protein